MNKLLICLLCLGLSGCSLVNHAGEVDWNGWMDWVKDAQGLITETLEIFEEEAPPEVSDDDQDTGPLFYVPIYSHVSEAIGPPGVQLCSGSYVPQHDPSEKAGSIAVGYFLLTRQSDGAKVKTCWKDLLIESPDGAYNWRDYDNENNCKHLYTTAYKNNESGQIDCPLADGTRRGRAFLQFEEDGLWDLSIMARCTNNRTSSAWIGLTLHDGQTHWLTWNQRGSGVGEEGYIEVPIMTDLMFKKTETEVAGGSSQ